MSGTKTKSKPDLFTDEYLAWCMSLPDKEYDRECRRRYQRTEYFIRHLDAHGDAYDMDFRDTKNEAIEACNDLDLDDGEAAIVSKVTRYYRGVDLAMIDDIEELLYERGDASAIEAGSWRDG